MAEIFADNSAVTPTGTTAGRPPRSHCFLFPLRGDDGFGFLSVAAVLRRKRFSKLGMFYDENERGNWRNNLGKKGWFLLRIGMGLMDCGGRGDVACPLLAAYV